MIEEISSLGHVAPLLEHRRLGLLQLLQRKEEEKAIQRNELFPKGKAISQTCSSALVLSKINAVGVQIKSRSNGKEAEGEKEQEREGWRK